MNYQDRKRISEIITILEDEFPDARIRLNHANPFELLIATILSAQCTDKRVNIVTKDLFEKYRTPADFANLKNEILEKEIFSTGFYKSKSKNIIRTSKIILEEYGGKVPNTREDLIKLPGVGRKTANVILGHCFNRPAIVVDTHVIRVTNRLGFVRTRDPVKIELKLEKLLPRTKWVKFTHLIISHGRKYCTAKNPKCFACPINYLCTDRKS